MTSSPQQLTDQIASSTQLLVVDFFSSWCSACRRLYPKLKQIAENNPDVIFVKVSQTQGCLGCQVSRSKPWFLAAHVWSYSVVTARALSHVSSCHVKFVQLTRPMSCFSS